VQEVPEKIEKAEPQTTTEEDKLDEAEEKDEKLAENKLNNNEVGLQGDEANTEVIRWTYTAEKLSDNTYELQFKADLAEGWHLYSQHLPSDDGPIATAFYFDEEKYNLSGEVDERGKLISDYDPNFEMDLNFFAKQVTFVQKIKTSEELVEAEFEFMVCDDKMCLPPELVEVEFDLKSGKGINVLEKADQEANLDVSGVIPALPNVDLENPVSDCGEEQESKDNGLTTIFLLGFFGGLIALLTPCVFPMIPLTVSFFTKGDGEGKGVGKALLYGFFIFAIYAVLSIPFHFNTDPEVLNEIATSAWLNIIFFAVFVVFAISFFGYFEITLPSSLTNKADSASQVGGVLGIFFMALTLALVSFSCTGPILGTVLGSALKNGPWPITAAMSGFGVALGLPFAIFATFPSMLNKLPQSGGWLNSVKVVLGFVELALAVKFLSNADLVEQWGLLKRETFFAIWTVIGIGLVGYLLGLIKFPHDSPIGRLSPFRIGFAALVLAFTIYIAPGVLRNSPWNHNLLSGFPPPTFYSWYEKEGFHAEFTDFETAMAEAKEQNKPLLIDFTGWACVNCRKMEESVWTVDEIKERLEEDFVLVSLYVDDKVLLPEEQQGVFEYQAGDETKKKKIKTIGNKWATFQTQVFNNNSQPYYVMLSPEGELLGKPVGYTPEVEAYADFLDCGLKAHEGN
jgi:thiol:disulfide interchange protein DsbD